MKLWIDNTGLHSAAQCLEGKASASHDYDVRALLQLATLIIFGNNISLNGFENRQIARRSVEIVERLRHLGVTDVFSISAINESEYALACRTTAEALSLELADAFNPNELQLVRGGPPDAPRGLRERQIAAIALAGEAKGSEKLRKAARSALRDKAIGAVEYMLGTSDALRDAVMRTVRLHPHWTDAHSYQLNIFIRYHLNVALAEQSRTTYAPAIARAELIERENEHLIAALERVSDDVVEELRKEPLGVPSTLSALVQRSRGEPEGLLRVAMEFRQRSGPLRNALESLSAKHSEDTPESRFEMRKVVNELGQQLRRDVGLEKSARLRDALELRLMIGVIPTLSMSGKGLLAWFEERRRKKQTAVLTELVKASAFADASPALYEKLRSRSMRDAG